MKDDKPRQKSLEIKPPTKEQIAAIEKVAKEFDLKVNIPKTASEAYYLCSYLFTFAKKERKRREKQEAEKYKKKKIPTLSQLVALNKPKPKK